MADGENDRSQKPLRLGRKPGDNDTAEIILNAAEAEFAANGYDKTSLAQITDAANVTTAMIRYYFGSKEGLFTAVVKRRGDVMRDERMRLLNELESRPGQPPTVEELIRAYVLPVVDTRRQGPGGYAYLRLQARLLVEDTPLAEELRRYVYGASVLRFIEAFQRALPHFDIDTIYWRLGMMIGGYFYMLAGTSHLEFYSGGNFSTDDLDNSIAQMVVYFDAAMKAPPAKTVRLHASETSS